MQVSPFVAAIAGTSALVGVLFCAAVGAQESVQADARGSSPVDAPATPATGADVPLDYLIGPGDQLQIFVWDHADLTLSLQVRPDGKISTPLVQDVQAAGKSPTTLARDVEKALAEYIRSPVVTVIVQSFVGTTDQQVKVVGQAVQPKAIRYRQNMTLLDVIIEVGGLAEFAAGNRARIVRNVDGESKEIRVRLDDLLNKGKIENNVPMLPGDVLIIPQSVL
jgi:polysaccharide export outer membrane protein